MGTAAGGRGPANRNTGSAAAQEGRPLAGEHRRHAQGLPPAVGMTAVTARRLVKQFAARRRRSRRADSRHQHPHLRGSGGLRPRPQPIPPEVIEATAAKYREAYERLTGDTL